MHNDGSATATAPVMTVLAPDAALRPAVPGEPGIRVVRQAGKELPAGHLFALTTATGLPEVAEWAKQASRQRRLRALFIEADVDPRWIPQMLERAHLRMLRNVLVHSGAALPGRVLRAWANGAQRELIADAQVAGDRLLIVSCALERLEVTFAQIPALAGLPAEKRSGFVIDDDGSFLYWPAVDVHLNLDAIRVAADPAYRKAAFRKKQEAERRYGAALARVRQGAGLAEAKLPGFSPEEVRRLERGQDLTPETLQRLARAHGMELGEYLKRVAEHLPGGPMARGAR